MSHAHLTIDDHTVTVTGPDPQAALTKLLSGTKPPASIVGKLEKARVTTTRTANAYLGHAVGVLVAGQVECIVITATTGDAQAFMDHVGVTQGDARFSTSVAMIQRKDVQVEPQG